MKYLLLGLSPLASFTVGARPPARAALPVSARLDTEVSTNVSFTAREARQKGFAWELVFVPTPSNNVQVAFGRDMNADGVLSPDEERLVAGWDCGEWFALDATNDVRVVDSTRPANDLQTLRFVFSTRPDGQVRSLAADSDGTVLFPELSSEPPAFLYDPEWNMFRLTARGAGDPQARLAVRTIPAGFHFIFR